LRRRSVSARAGRRIRASAHPPAKSPVLSKDDLDTAEKYLETTRKNFVEVTKGLSDEQWNFKAGPDRWSVAQVMEHIAAAEDLLRDMIVDQVLKALAPAALPLVLRRRFRQGVQLLGDSPIAR